MHAGTLCFYVLPRTRWLFLSFKRRYESLIVPVRLIFSRSRAPSSSHYARPAYFLPLTGTIILSSCPSGSFSPTHGHYHPLMMPVRLIFSCPRALSSYSNPSYPLTPCLSRLSPNTYHPSHPAASPNSAAAVQITPSDHPSPALANC